MEHLIHILEAALIHILQGVFVAGMIGCAITIPICAWKYFAVLFEADTDESRESPEASQAAD